jgi:hypothetical protein
MTKKCLGVLAALLFALSASMAQAAAVILERPLDNTRPGIFSSYNPDTSFQRTASSFELAVDATLTDVHWWGWFEPAADLSRPEFRIRIYSANQSDPTIPGAQTYEQVVSPDLMDTGLTRPWGDTSVVVWEIWADPVPALPLLAGQNYWIEVAHIAATGNDEFVWAGATTSEGDLVVRGDDSLSWIVFGTPDTALSLTGIVVPLPPAVWLFGSGLLGLIGIARRRKSA